MIKMRYTAIVTQRYDIEAADVESARINLNHFVESDGIYKAVKQTSYYCDLYENPQDDLNESEDN